MTDLQKQIEEVIGQLVRLDKIEDQLRSTKKELKDASREITLIEKQLNLEAQSIDSLDGLSTKAIFHKILGNQEQQLEKGRQNFLELNLQYEDLQKAISLYEYEENLLEAKLGSRKTIENQLDQLKLLREEEIFKTDPLLRTELQAISVNLENNYHLKQELEEAIQVGEICFNMVNQIASHLQRVKNWGGRSNRRQRTIKRHVRRESIDRARNLASQVKHHLNLFDKELRDIGKRLSIELDTTEFNNFTNFFFDNLITDWIIHQKITSALNSVIQTGRQLKSLLIQLKDDFDQSQEEIISLRGKREQILLKREK